MFRRRSTTTDAAARPDGDLAVATDPGGKGRATPSRKQAEAERMERLKASSRGDAKRSRTSSRTASAGSRTDARKRAIAGHEDALAPRDRGPARRYARELVDSHRSIGQYFLFLAIAVLVIGLVPATPARVFSQVLLGLVIIALAVDSVRINRRVSRAVHERFPDGTEGLDGVGRYAMMRAMVTRRLRVPAPQVRLDPPFSRRGRTRA